MFGREARLPINMAHPKRRQTPITELWQGYNFRMITSYGFISKRVAEESSLLHCLQARLLLQDQAFTQVETTNGCVFRNSVHQSGDIYRWSIPHFWLSPQVPNLFLHPGQLDINVCHPYSCCTSTYVTVNEMLV